MRLEPLGAQQRHEQIDEQEHGDDDGQPDHGRWLLDLVAASDKREQRGHHGETQQQQSGQPHEKVPFSHGVAPLNNSTHHL
jgi:hypothetical protein